MKKRRHIETFLVFTTLFLGYFFFNDVIGPRAEEPRRAIVGIEAILGDNILVPTINGEAYYNKPPIFNWILGISFLVFDSFGTEALRFPGVLSLWLIAGILVFLVRRSHGAQAGLFSGLIFLTLGDLFFYGSINAGEIDLFYALITFIQIISIFWFGEKKKWIWLFVSSYLLTSIGLLTKGLPSLAFQAFTLIAYFISVGRFKYLLTLKHFLGILLMLVTVGSYFKLYSRYDDASAFMVNLWSESSSKSANEGSAGSIIKALYSFPLQLIQITLPWSIFLIWWKELRKSKSTLVTFSFVFFASNIWLYWISPDLRNRYLYTFFPFIAIILGVIVSNLSKRDLFNRITSRVSGAISILVGLTMLVIPLTSILTDHSLPKVSFSIFGMLFLGLGFYQLKTLGAGVIHLLLVLSSLRLAYNFCILPIQAEKSKAKYYSDQMDRVLDITEGDQVYWTGGAYKFYPEISLAGKTIVVDSIQTPPLLAYQIPYYYSVKTGERFLYEESPCNGNWYISQENFALSLKGRIHFTFEDKWTQKNLVLYTID